MSGFEDNLPDLKPNPVMDPDYLAGQTDKHLHGLNKRLLRSIEELQRYQRLVSEELAGRVGVKHRP